MKKSFILLSFAALSAAVLVSCNKEVGSVIENEQPSVQSLTFAISDNSETKAVLTEDGGKYFGEWVNGDRLGSITTKSNGYSSIDVSKTPVTFKVYSSGGLAEGNTINLWYPYSTTQSNPASVTLSIPTTQKQYGTSLDFSAMPMVAEQITVTAEMVSHTDNTPVAVVGFYNLGSVIDFCIYTGTNYTAEKVISVSFNAATPIAGDFTKDITTVHASDESTLTISGYMEKSVTTELYANAVAGTDSDHPLHVYMVVAPGSYTGTVTVTTNVADYTWTISSAKEFLRSGIRSLGLKLDKSASATRKDRGTIKGLFSFDLTKASYSSASSSAASWGHGILTMDAAKGSASTATNNYMPPAYTSTRFYAHSTLSFTPGTVQIEKVVCTASSDSYATALANSTKTNASATASATAVTIVPTDGSAAFGFNDVSGTVGLTEVKVYYDNTDYTISKAAVANGTIDVAGDLTSAKVNTTINLTATPASGYTFVGWTVTDSGDNPVPMVGDSFQMPASDVLISATFTPTAAAKTITITTPSNGSVATSPSGTAFPGETVTITATPEDGYAVNTIAVVDEDSTPVAVSDNQFTMPDKNVTVTVTFVRAYVLTCSRNSGNSAYASYYTVNQGGLSWDAPGNQTFSDYWQIGGLKKSKSEEPANTDTRYICMTGESTLDFDVSTITIYTNGVNNANLTINSITVTAHNSEADAKSGANVYASFTTTATLVFAVNTDKELVYTKTGTADCTGKYFRVAINATNNTTNNHGLKVKSIRLQ